MEAEATIIQVTEDIASYQAQLAELEPLFASSVAARSAGPSPTSYPTRCTAEWNTGQYYRHVRHHDPWEQARGWRRLATKHDQSAAHNEDDGGRDAATRRYQGSPSRRVVRLMIATINVTCSGGATSAHITGRMAELDHLFSEAGLDIIGVQESRLPQTPLSSTLELRQVKHHYGVQLWVKKRHAKAVLRTTLLGCCMSLSFTHRAKWLHHTTLTLFLHASAGALERCTAWSVVSTA